MADRQEDNIELENDTETVSQDEIATESLGAEELEAMSDADETVTIEAIDEIETSVTIEAIAEEAEFTPAVKADSAGAGARTVSANGGSSALPKMLLLFGVIIAVGAGLVFWKNTVVGQHGGESYKVSKEEMELLLKDFPPAQRKQMAESPDQKKQLVDNLKQLLAIASQAKKDGFASDPLLTKDFEYIKKAIYAAGYDKKINSDKGPMPQFGFISEDQVKEYWGENGDQSGLSWIWNGAKKRRHEAEFQSFIDTKLELARNSGQIPKDKEPSEEELKQARDQFAKSQIYYEEVMDKLSNLGSLPAEEQKDWKDWKEATELQIKLQEAQLITQNYVREVLTKKFEVTEKDIQAYLAEHPELNNDAEQKKKAEDLLAKVKEGGDFAELAEEFSEDPGSKNKGGLYEGVAKGQFAPEFEAAAMALEPGQVAENIVKTNFGYHIIKLEKKGEAKGTNGQTQQTFDARHILISTMVKDPDNPAAREQPLDQFVKSKLEKEKQKKILDEIVANNPVEVAEDFEVPEVTEAELKQQEEAQKQQMQQMQQQQQGGPPQGAPQQAGPPQGAAPQGAKPPAPPQQPPAPPKGAEKK